MSEPKISTKQNMSEAFAELRKLNPLLELTNREINGIDFKVFENAPKTMRDLFGAIELLQGDFPFISEDDKELSFLESMAKAKSICKFLLDEGIKPNDRVGICMQNCTEWAVIYLALAGYGATAVPFNSWWKTEELNYGIELSLIHI